MSTTGHSPRRAAIDVRISKAERKAPKGENQIAICQARAGDHGYSIPDEFHVDADDGIAASEKAISDTTRENRPAARRLTEAPRAGQVDVLIEVEASASPARA